MWVWGATLTIGALQLQIYIWALIAFIFTAIMFTAFYTYAEILIKLILKGKRK
jgi:hypothetical protein